MWLLKLWKTDWCSSTVIWPVCGPAVSYGAGLHSCWGKVSPSLRCPFNGRQKKNWQLIQSPMLVLKSTNSQVTKKVISNRCTYSPHFSDSCCVNCTKLQLLFLLQKVRKKNSVLDLSTRGKNIFCIESDSETCTHRERTCELWLTSSLQMSLMNSWASCMAPGDGANTENVSSSTWLIVTPQQKKKVPVSGGDSRDVLRPTTYQRCSLKKALFFFFTCFSL